ncbi:hypothetical protein GOBAR_DD16438 [Gossypium barbadense]|nr:hypothetical protein GOBAR_DD16438 [Gossypium barbadense]
MDRPYWLIFPFLTAKENDKSSLAGHYELRALVTVEQSCKAEIKCFAIQLHNLFFCQIYRHWRQTHHFTSSTRDHCASNSYEWLQIVSSVCTKSTRKGHLANGSNNIILNPTFEDELSNWSGKGCNILLHESMEDGKILPLYGGDITFKKRRRCLAMRLDLPFNSFALVSSSTVFERILQCAIKLYTNVTTTTIICPGVIPKFSVL